VGILQPRLIEIAMKILSGVIERDIKKISENLISLNEIEKDISIPDVEKRIKFVLDNWQTGSVVEMTMAEVFYRLLLAAQESGIAVPLPIFVLGKTVLEYDGLLRKFDPEMDILNSLKGYVGQDSLLDLKNIQVSIKELLANPQNLPDAVLKIVKQLNEEGVEFISHLINTASAHK
jgi:predicted unusual protein kinase regulating ubiquinone biosynthesis (AarF/ABC1/UbiB family)